MEGGSRWSVVLRSAVEREGLRSCRWTGSFGAAMAIGTGGFLTRPVVTPACEFFTSLRWDAAVGFLRSCK